MNIYTPKTAKTKFPGWEFRGKPFQRNGKTWIKAKNHGIGLVWFYCFDNDEIYDQILWDIV